MDTLSRDIGQRVPAAALVLPETLDQARVVAVVRGVVPYNPHYARMVLKRVVARLEAEGQEVEEELYQEYCALLSAVPLSAQETDMVGYTVGTPLQVVVVQERPQLISGYGTTGLRTWEAASYLARWLVADPAWCEGAESVLELGTGTGLVGTAVALYVSQVQRVVVTDGDANVVETAHNTMGLNKVDPARYEARVLWWGRDSVPACDVVVAADVTYDASVVGLLLDTIELAFAAGARAAYVAATIRNEDTIAAWETVLQGRVVWSVPCVCAVPAASAFYYPPGTPEIRVYRLVPM